MSADTTSPAYVFVHALEGQLPTKKQLHDLDPDWSEPVQAAIAATPVNRRAALILAKSGITNIDRLTALLRGNPDPEDRPWPDPTPFGAPRLPAFPDRALPGWIGIYVRAEARATQTPTDLAGMLALAVLSAACAGPIVLNPWGDWIEPLNLFTLVALPPGHRKSAIFASITAPLVQFEAERAVEAAPLLALARRRQHAAEQALIRAQDAAALCSADDPNRPQLLEAVEHRLADLNAAETPVVPRLVTDDCSPEKLAMLLSQHGGRLAILSPEGGLFDMIAGRYSSTGAPNLDHYLKGHAGDPIIVDRVGRPGEVIPHPALTVGLAVQPEVLRNLVARPGFHGRGLLARFLYAVPAATLGRRDVALEPVDNGFREFYHRQIRALLTLTHPSPRTQHLEPSTSVSTPSPPTASESSPSQSSPASPQTLTSTRSSTGPASSSAPPPGSPASSTSPPSTTPVPYPLSPITSSRAPSASPSTSPSTLKPPTPLWASIPSSPTPPR